MSRRGLISGLASGHNPGTMGRGDNRHTAKMTRKRNQRKLKDRLRRRAEQTRRQRAGEADPVQA